MVQLPRRRPVLLPLRLAGRDLPHDRDRAPRRRSRLGARHDGRVHEGARPGARPHRSHFGSPDGRFGPFKNLAVILTNDSYVDAVRRARSSSRCSSSSSSRATCSTDCRSRSTATSRIPAIPRAGLRRRFAASDGARELAPPRIAHPRTVRSIRFSRSPSRRSTATRSTSRRAGSRRPTAPRTPSSRTSADSSCG